MRAWSLGAALSIVLHAAPAAGQEEAPLDETRPDAPPAWLLLPEEEPAPEESKPADLALGLSLGASALSMVLGAEALGIGENADLPALRVVGIGLIAGGAIAGPSAGLWYREETRRAWISAGLRAGLLGASGALLAAGLSRGEPDLASVALIGGAAFLSSGAVASAGIDIIRAGAPTAPAPAEEP